MDKRVPFLRARFMCMAANPKRHDSISTDIEHPTPPISFGSSVMLQNGYTKINSTYVIFRTLSRLPHQRKTPCGKPDFGYILGHLATHRSSRRDVRPPRPHPADHRARRRRLHRLRRWRLRRPELRPRLLRRKFQPRMCKRRGTGPFSSPIWQRALGCSRRHRRGTTRLEQRTASNLLGQMRGSKES